MSARCYFDDSLPRFAALVSEFLGPSAFVEHLFLRDAAGRLTLVLRGEAPRQHREEVLTRLAQAAHASIAPYIEAPDLAVATPNELYSPELVGAGTWEWIEHPAFTGFVCLAERRIVGQDWLIPPQQPLPGAPPIIVFASHKGGVGRTTAMVVAAADFAARGKNVLTLDLDLEAPGLGGMLLDEERTPLFGALDFFTENGLGPLDDQFLSDLYGVSPLTAGQGLVHVVPAVGQRSVRDPQNVLAKLARAYLEDPTTDGNKSFLQQTRDLIRCLTERNVYDAVLIDARAGLHESTSAAILGLGADVLLFGIDTPQTFTGYQYLLAHLARFKPTAMDDPEWRLNLRFVHAKATADPASWAHFDDQTYDLFAKHIYDIDDPDDQDPGSRPPLNFDAHSQEAPHVAWRILSDANYSEFDPPTRSQQLSEPLYSRTFGSFLTQLRQRLELD